jgi:hypothetical protein
MPRGTLMLVTIAVIIAVGIGPRARAQELSCPPGYAPNSSNTGCIPSQPSAGSAQGSVAGQAQQLLNSFGAAVQGAPSKAAGALGGMLNSFGLQGSAATPNEVAPNADNGATAQGGSSNNFGNPANGVEPFVNNMGLLKGSSGAPKVGNSGTARGGGPCALLTADDVAAVLGEPVKGEVQQSYMREEAVTGGGMTDPGCRYVTADNMRMVFLTLPLHRGRAGFDETVQLDEAASKPGTLSYGSPELAAEMRQDNAARARMAPERLSGVGDKAYLVPGPQEVQVLVLKGNTFFDISTLDTNGAKESTSRWAVALARKVAARL